MHERENALKEWLSQIFPHQPFTITPLTGDASFRRYFRLTCQGKTKIVMDAPPNKEDLEPFLHVAQILTEAKIPAPEVFAVEKSQGFLLLSDLGDELLLKHLTTDKAHKSYIKALDTLLAIQKCSIDDPKLPVFDKPFMLQEMNLCPEWFFKRYLSLVLDAKEQHMLDQTLDWLATEIAQQPLVFIHRDYHSRNLMVLNESPPELGVIDFQDAMRGPLTYDLASLLKDCYIAWPREQVIQWIRAFYQQSTLVENYRLDDFMRAFDLAGLQRHIKVLGIFCRLYLRDGKSGYLGDLPQVMRYVLECCEMYPELNSLFSFLQNRVFLP